MSQSAAKHTTAGANLQLFTLYYTMEYTMEIMIIPNAYKILCFNFMKFNRRSARIVHVWLVSVKFYRFLTYRFLNKMCGINLAFLTMVT